MRIALVAELKDYSFQGIPKTHAARVAFRKGSASQSFQPCTNIKADLVISLESNFRSDIDEARETL